MNTVAERVSYMMSELGLTQNTQFGAIAGASRSVVGQWLGGEIKSIAPKYAFNIQRNAGFNAQWVMLGTGNVKVEITTGSVEQVSPVYSNFVELPVLNVHASMGVGSDVAEEIVVDMLRVSKEWVTKTLSPISNIANLAFIHAIGNSMSPTFEDGDILLVDSGNITMTSDDVYVIEANDRLYIKRVRQRIDGVFEISSDNPAVKTVDVLNGDNQVTIKGRVVWAWNGRKV